MPTTTGAWSRADQRDRFRFALHVADRTGGWTFTLNLSPARERAMWKVDDPAREIAAHVRRAFKTLKLPRLSHYAFRLEVSPGGRLHVHGAIATKVHSRDDLVAGLMKAGGKVKGHAASRQVEIKPFDWDRGGPSGWEAYTWLDRRFTARRLGVEKLTFISAGLRQLAASTWDRQRTKRSFKVPAVSQDKSVLTYIKPLKENKNMACGDVGDRASLATANQQRATCGPLPERRNLSPAGRGHREAGTRDHRRPAGDRSGQDQVDVGRDRKGLARLRRREKD